MGSAWKELTWLLQAPLLNHHVKSRTHAQGHKHRELHLKENMLTGQSSARELVHILLNKNDLSITSSSVI